ncbi:MAG: transglutaminase-like domain-containing protein [Acutalibacteraceae bacterium]|nr:transglutaminase-like domain-containing protein [Acutalibacteraceae bacterium]
MKKTLSLLIILIIFCGTIPAIGISADAQTSNSSASSSSTSSSATKTTSSVQPSGKYSSKVQVDIPKSFKATEKLNYVKLSWKCNSKATGYIISRSTDKNKWEFLTTVTDNKTVKYIDKTANENILYYYSIKAYVKKGKTNYFSKVSDTIPIFFGPNFHIASYSDSAKLKWNKISEATGYEVYFSENRNNFKLLKRYKKNTYLSYTKKDILPYKKNYYFYITAYKTVNNKRNCIYTSNIIETSDTACLINGSVDKPVSSYITKNVQGKKSSSYSSQISSNDKKIIKNFNAEYFSSDMPAYDKIYYTFMFIHEEITYATGALWSKIGDSTYVDAIFNKKLGQCAQYNGAMVEYLVNLGINAKLIMGYRGTSVNNRWQHFWGEVKLKNGKTYVLETGNYGNDGPWYYFFTPYKYTKKYLKCGKYVSGIKV